MELMRHAARETQPRETQDVGCCRNEWYGTPDGEAPFRGSSMKATPDELSVSDVLALKTQQMLVVNAELPTWPGLDDGTEAETY